LTFVPLKFGASADALVAIDDQGRIVHWNDAATRLLGWDAAEAVGRRCHEVLLGLTPAGAHLCGPNCPVRESCRELRAPRRFEMVVRHADGAELWLEATTCIVLDEEDRPVAIHVLSEAVSARRLADLAETVVRRVSKPVACSPAAGSGQTPTRRELDVLSLLAEGLGTDRIAARLGLSSATVRNHVQNVLLKLGAHSRAEAVVMAIRNNLVQTH
jgi:PAS domain S-box-containing protein